MSNITQNNICQKCDVNKPFKQNENVPLTSPFHRGTLGNEPSLRIVLRQTVQFLCEVAFDDVLYLPDLTCARLNNEPEVATCSHGNLQTSLCFPVPDGSSLGIKLFSFKSSARLQTNQTLFGACVCVCLTSKICTCLKSQNI